MNVEESANFLLKIVEVFISCEYNQISGKERSMKTVSVVRARSLVRRYIVVIRALSEVEDEFQDLRLHELLVRIEDSPGFPKGRRPFMASVKCPHQRRGNCWMHLAREVAKKKAGQ